MTCWLSGLKLRMPFTSSLSMLHMLAADLQTYGTSLCDLSRAARALHLRHASRETLAAAMMRRGVVEGWTIEIAKLNCYDGAPCRLPKYQSGSMVFKLPVEPNATSSDSCPAAQQTCRNLGYLSAGLQADSGTKVATCVEARQLLCVLGSGS